MSSMWPCFPPEILTEILCYVKSDGVEITNPSTYPTNLRLVCKSWQTILLSAPEIWSHIHINLDRVYPPHPSNRRISEHRQGTMHNKLLSAFQMCLDRSKSLPLTIHLRSRYFSGGDRQRELLGSILTVCLRHSERWLDVSFDFGIGGFVFIFPPGRAYPRLRILRLRSAPNDAGLFPSSRHLLLSKQAGPFSNARSLNEVHLRLFPKCPLPQLHIPWSQITHFSVSMFDCIFTEGLRCAALMPNLVSWTLRELGLDILANEYFDHYVASLPSVFSPPALSPLTSTPIEQQNLPPLITLPALETFRLSSHGSITDSPLLFTRLQTPRLSSLEIHFSRPPQSWGWINAFEKYIAHSQCTITSLAIKKFSAVGVLVFLILLSGVEELVLEDVEFTKELLGMLTYPDGSRISSSSSSVSPLEWSYVGRRIRKMVIDKPKFVNLEHGPEMLVSMIRSRLPVTVMAQSRHDTGSGTGRDRMEWVELSSLRVVTSRASRSPNTGAYGGSRSTPSLYRFLEQSFVGYDSESSGVNLVFEEEPSDGVGNEAGSVAQNVLRDSSQIV